MKIQGRQYKTNQDYPFVSITEATPEGQWKEFDRLIRASEADVDRIGADIEYSQNLVRQGHRFSRRPDCYVQMERLVNACLRLAGIKDS